MRCNKTHEWLVISAGLMIPLVITYIYFDLLAAATAGTQYMAMALGKIVQFGLPVVWVFIILRQSLSEELNKRFGNAEGLVAGLLFGLLVAVAMLLLYHYAIKSTGWMDLAADKIRDKIVGFNIDSVSKYAALGLFYSLAHSLLEEYYWRWFVFGRLRCLVRVPVAIVVSGLGFMVHHILVLATYFGWASLVTYVFSFSVAMGGAVWAWLYHRYGSLWGPWLSHALVDAAIFFIGYDVIRS